MEVLWKELEVCDTRGSRWKYVGVYRRHWKLPRNPLVEAAIDRSFHFRRQWKLYAFSRKLPLTSAQVNLVPLASMEMSMEVNQLPPTSMEFSLEFMEISMEVKREIVWRVRRGRR